MQDSAPHRPVVLLVEDEPLVLEAIAVDLQEVGFEVIAARSGEEAAQALERGGRIDLLFTDLLLPGAIDGWEVAERARRRYADIPVIYATGFVEEDPRRVKDSLFMNKPYRTAEIVEAAVGLGVRME